MVELLEREQLLGQLEGLRAEAGRLVFVGGEAGVGKTALVRAFADRVGGSRRGEPRRPDTARAVPRRRARRDEHEQWPLLRSCAAERVVLEDVHWADGASLDVLRVLRRRVDGSDAFVVATYRDDEVTGGYPLRVVLGEPRTSRGVVRVSVPRLSLDAVRELAEPHGADAEAIAFTQETPSTSPRSSRQGATIRPRCATRCSREPPFWPTRPDACSRRSRSSRVGPSSGC